MPAIRRRSLALVFLLPLAAAGCGATLPAPEPAPAPGTGTAPEAAPMMVLPVRLANGEDLVRAMHARYQGRWYRTLRFKQTVKRAAGPDGVVPPEEVWTEYAEVPGGLRIEFGDPAAGNGVLYARDSLYVFRAGGLVRKQAERNPLAVLGFDVYGQSPEETIRELRADGFDLSKLREDTWEGRSVYVVGADAGDMRSKQFWVERERLLFVRLIEPAGPDGSRTGDIRFQAYRPLGGGWIAPVVVFLVDGRETMREDYFDIAIDLPNPPGAFDPARWSERR